MIPTTWKRLDSVGTLELYDTRKRCTVRDVRILAVRCTKGCVGGETTFLHDAIRDQYWLVMKSLNGYHQGCDPESIWVKDPVAARLQQSMNKRLIDDAHGCPACGETSCPGAVS